MLLVVAALALVVWPWANQQTQELKDRYGKRGDLERVAPGQFQESASGKRVFFLDKDTPDNKSGKNIFISTNERGKETVTSARSGQHRDHRRRPVPGAGQRPAAGNHRRQRQLKISEFEEYGTRVGANELAARDRRAGQDAAPPSRSDGPDAAPTWASWRGAWAWRWRRSTSW